jgi:hypothetical protein
MKVGRSFQDAGEARSRASTVVWVAGSDPQPVRRKRSVVAGARRPGRDVRDTIRAASAGSDSGRQGLGRGAPPAPEGEPEDRRTRAGRVGGGLGDVGGGYRTVEREF